MFKPLSIYIGSRYTRSKHKNNFISFISLASMLGIMFGVIVLITVLSVMNGFEKELRARILGMISHVTVTETNGKLSDWRDVQDSLLENQEIKGIAPFIKKQVMLSANKEVRGVLIQGVLPEEQDKVSDLAQSMIGGELSDLKPKTYNIAIGAELASSLGIFIGDKVSVITPFVKVTPAGVIPRMKRFTVAAIYKKGLPQFDNNTAFIHMRDAAKLLRLKDDVSGLRIKLDNLFEAPLVAQNLQTELGDSVEVIDWGLENKTFFRAVKTEKIVMFFILFLIILVAIFNLISSLVMVVNDKQPDIAILKTLGMSSNNIRNIFMVQGSLIGFFGVLMGTVLGVILVANLESVIGLIESLIGRQIFPADVFYISRIPTDMHWNDVFWIALISFVLSILATIYPAKRAAKIQPAESLRYE